MFKRSNLFCRKMRFIDGLIDSRLATLSVIICRPPFAINTAHCRNLSYHKGTWGKFSVDRSNMADFSPPPVSDGPAVPKEERTPLTKDLLSYIQLKGPISIHDFMAQTSNHLLHGYYQSEEAKFGEKGDFLTAPEISQVFGEVVGLWCVLQWQEMGCPSEISLVELGPGKGSLMVDLLRVASRFPAFYKSLSVHLVELSQSLRHVQRQSLSISMPTDSGAAIADSQPFSTTAQPAAQLDAIPVHWYTFISQVPKSKPCLFIGQEFLDAFPVHQFTFTGRSKGWRERLIDIDISPSSPFHFRPVLSPSATPAVKSLLQHPSHVSSSSQQSFGSAAAKEGDGLEVCPLALATIEDVSRRLTLHGGRALFVDYGEDFTQEDSLRAFRKHEQVPFLSMPGTADLTADVDFLQCRRAAERCGVEVLPLSTQGQWLMQMGAVERVQQLIDKPGTSEEQANTLVSSLKMLVDPAVMGSKFKVLQLKGNKLSKFR